MNMIHMKMGYIIVPKVTTDLLHPTLVRRCASCVNLMSACVELSFLVMLLFKLPSPKTVFTAEPNHP